MTSPRTARSASVADTERWGEWLAPHVHVGDVITLTGPLGAGKTRFVGGLARGLDAKARVRSPSFTLVNEYRARVPIFHLDLYRLDAPEFERLGLDEALERGVVVVEWGERLPQSWRHDALAIAIAITGPEMRTLEAQAHGPRAEALMAAWFAEAETHARSRAPGAAERSA